MRHVVIASLLLLGACANVDSGGAFDKTASLAEQRTGQRAVWNRGGEAEARAMAEVRRLLERPLDADTAVQVALLNSPRLQAEYEEFGIALADLVESGLLENPVFSAERLHGSEGRKRSFGVVQDFLGVLTWPARARAAAAGREASILALADHVIETAAEVRTAWTALVADAQRVEMYRQVVGAGEAMADLAARRRAAGNASRLAQAVDQGFYARAALALARAEAQLASDRELLNKRLGLNGDDVSWSLPDRLPDPPTESVSLEGLEALAITQRLDLEAARLGVRQAAYAHELQASLGWLRVLGIGFSWEREPGGARLRGPNLEIAVPLFNQGQPTATALEGEVRRRSRLLAALAVDIRADVRAGWTRLEAARAAVAHFRTALLPLAEATTQETQLLYNGMLVSPLELLRARQEQVETGRDYVEALRDYWTARAALERVLGGPLPQPPR